VKPPASMLSTMRRLGSLIGNGRSGRLAYDNEQERYTWQEEYTAEALSALASIPECLYHGASWEVRYLPWHRATRGVGDEPDRHWIAVIVISVIGATTTMLNLDPWGIGVPLVLVVGLALVLLDMWIRRKY